MATSKGIKSVAICVLLLGLVLEQVQVEGKSCCPSTSARNVYNVCRLTGASRPTCASLSGCKIVDGSTCPGGYPKLHLHLHESGEPNVTEYCTIGCMNSVCDNIVNVIRSQEMKIDMELCNNACARFCNKGVVVQSSEA